MVPGLRTCSPEVDLWGKPGRVVEAARSNPDELREPREPSKERRAAVWTEAAVDLAPVVVVTLKIAWLALRQREGQAWNEHGGGVRRATRVLTITAVTVEHVFRFCVTLVANMTASAAAGERSRHDGSA